ncbi:chromate reductase [Rhodoligotrophos appendicifer]|uniref:NADPH-dependent FMN reductase n=1 Tax=Rhodoligotrophos appendicifer TaxID=987056 RepID=UPI0011863537|nr:NADPH-dependent FMN reductase [Rhodoligotrophos appendicifer]
MTNVAVFVGSLRKASINHKLALALAKLASPETQFRIVELGDVPMFNQDLEADLPAPVVRMKQEIASADGVLLVTPEYNRSFTPVLKNALDWGSRPYGHNIWKGKPVAMVGTSGSSVGTAAAQAALRPILPILHMHLLSQPEVYLVWKEGLVDADHTVTDEGTRKFLANFVEKFEGWAKQFKI